MARRQAMSSAMSGQLQKTRADLSERARGTEQERYGELVQKSDDDKESLQKDVRKDDQRIDMDQVAALKLRIEETGVHHYPRTAGTQTGAKLTVILRAFKELFKLSGKIKRGE